MSIFDIAELLLFFASFLPLVFTSILRVSIKAS